MAQKNSKMKEIYLFFAVLIHVNMIRGATIIDSGIRRSNIIENLPEEDADECSSLISVDLVNEIRSYQTIVDQIVAAAIDSDFSGSTWKRCGTWGFYSEMEIFSFILFKVLQNSPMRSVVECPVRRTLRKQSIICW